MEKVHVAYIFATIIQTLTVAGLHSIGHTSSEICSCSFVAPVLSADNTSSLEHL
ncbi:hypothetical protein SOVF_122800 [Spinacia oleracea]|nr:hypothetical protein SOVF_122800 [Spinacia oleracea]